MRANRTAALFLVLFVAVGDRAAAVPRPSRIEIRLGDRVVTNRRHDPGTIRVLFVGNSLTYWNEMPWMLEQMAASIAGPRIAAEFEGGSGMSLRQHLERGRAVRAIRERRFDYVVIQGRSTEPSGQRDEFLSNARDFDREIRRRGAKTVLFLTWANEGKRQSAISEPYLLLARELHVIVAPVGIAWERLQASGRNLFDGSGRHPNLQGSYLAACVFYAVLTGKSPIGLSHRFDVHFDLEESYRAGLETERISADDALEIQRAARNAVARAPGAGRVEGAK